MPTPEQERQWIAKLEEMGPTQVRRLLDRHEISNGFVFISAQWLADRDRKAESREEASKAEQMALMRRASIAAESQASEARRANTRATIALIMAIISIAVSTIGIWLPYWQARK
jgi:hypothetical protein